LFVCQPDYSDIHGFIFVKFLEVVGLWTRNSHLDFAVDLSPVPLSVALQKCRARMGKITTGNPMGYQQTSAFMVEI